MKYNLKISCRIWQNVTNSLIDIESDKSISQSITIDNSGYLSLKENNLIFSKFPIHNAPFLCKIVPHKDIYEIDLDESDSKDLIDLDDVPWIISQYIFKSNNTDEGYILHEGDLIKIGKHILRIRQIKIRKEKENMINTMIGPNHFNYNSNNNNNNLRIIKYGDDDNEDISHNYFNPKEVSCALKLKSSSLLEQNSINVFKENHNNNNNQLLLLNSTTPPNQQYNNSANANNAIPYSNDLKPSCRICLSDAYQDPNDPMITPCKCSGTMKYLHLLCLRKFIESKITTFTSNDNVTVLSFKSIECDICKTVFPEKIKIKGTSHIIIDLHRPSISNYIIIEGIINEPEGDNGEMKSLFIIDFKHSDSITIGRSSNSNMKLGDISVSRTHAEIILKNNTFQLMDNRSKFGTLINSSNHLSILPGKPLQIQKRNYRLKFRMKGKLCTVLSCYKPRDLPYRTYNEYLGAMSKFKRNIKELDGVLLTEIRNVDEYEEDKDKDKDRNRRKEKENKVYPLIKKANKSN